MAEGGALLRRYTGKTRIEGSNPSHSATSLVQCNPLLAGVPASENVLGRGSRIVVAQRTENRVGDAVPPSDTASPSGADLRAGTQDGWDGRVDAYLEEVDRQLATSPATKTEPVKRAPPSDIPPPPDAPPRSAEPRAEPPPPLPMSPQET